MRIELLEEWDEELNQGININDIREHSARKFWWRCKKYPNHSWLASMDNRSKGSGCPYCANVKVMVNFNDLAFTNPELIKEWNYEKNKDIKPTMYTKGSGKKVWWICEKGHEWEATIASRTRLGTGCPYCNGNRILVGTNDLATTHRQLAKQWDYEKNGNTKPTGVSAKSNNYVYWVCKNGHSWRAKVVNRVNKPDCPYCSGRRAIPYETDFMTMYPRLKAEWDSDSELNRGVNPYELVHYKGKYFGWKCEKGHIWSATVNTRIKGSGCPYCNGIRAIRNENDLETLMPNIAKEWCYEKNGQLLPCDVMLGSSTVVWWRCQKGHEWKASIWNRAKPNGTNCPYCKGKKAIVGENDLVTSNPEIVEEWDYEKNGNLVPSKFMKYSGRKVYWKCKNGHSWRTRISERTKGRGCPYC